MSPRRLAERRVFWGGGSLALLLSCGFCLDSSASERPLPVIDLHVDLPYRSVAKGQAFARGSGQFATDQFERGGLFGVVLPLFVALSDATADPSCTDPKSDSAVRAPRVLRAPTAESSRSCATAACLFGRLTTSGERCKQGRTPAEFERLYAGVYERLLLTPPYSLPGCGVLQAAGQARSVSTWLSFEGTGEQDASEEAIAGWILRGVRVFGLVHQEANRLGTSSAQPEVKSGLSAEGEKYVSLVFAHGGIMDVSHASKQTTSDILRLAEQQGGKVLASHSNAYALAPHVRNLTDEHIRRIAKLGGVVGLNFYQAYLRGPGHEPNMSALVKQVQHLRKLGGDSVLALGSDFEGGIKPVEGLENAGEYQSLARALVREKLPRAALEGLYFRNAWRVLCGVEFKEKGW